jgi:hypothetical protein
VSTGLAVVATTGVAPAAALVLRAHGGVTHWLYPTNASGDYYLIDPVTDEHLRVSTENRHCPGYKATISIDVLHDADP